MTTVENNSMINPVILKLKQSTAICVFLIATLANTMQPVLATDGQRSDVQEDKADAGPEQVGTSVYPADFFAQYTPQNAMDMIARLPGFSFDGGSDARGFGGNAGNVLIDGARPTSKSRGLEDALQRIPAAQVERIEILRGGIAAGEASGQSIVANVIKKKTGSTGTWNANLTRAEDGRYRGNLVATLDTKLGEWDGNFGLNIGSDAQARTAIIETRNSSQSLVSGASEINRTGSRWLLLNGEVSRPVGGGKLTLNGNLEHTTSKGYTQRDIFDKRLPVEDDPDSGWTLDDRRSEYKAELGVDWARTFPNEWKLRVIGLGLVHDIHTENDFLLTDFLTNATNDSQFSQDRLKTEFITRTTYGKVGSSKLRPEFGIEVANNRLDTSLDYIVDGADQQLASANVVVKEWRSEAFANLVYNHSSNLILDAGITGEISRITVSGDAGSGNTFKFIKPRVAATYKFNQNTQVVLEATRKVGQLDFNDFAASTEASDDRTTGGNPDLAPDKTTAVSATLDWGFSKRGSLKVIAFHEWRSDILEQIVLPSGSQGLGNAGDGRYWGALTKLKLPIDFILPGGLIDVTYNLRRSRFHDPIIGANRVISLGGSAPNYIKVEFRQDIPAEKITWGIGYGASYTTTNYRVDEILKYSPHNRFSAFIETTRFFGVKTELEVTNLNTGYFTRSRFFYDGDRSGSPNGSEVALRKNNPAIRLSISGTF